MKKTLCATVLLAVAATAAQAQSPSFGIKAGASLTNFADRGSFKNKLGFNGGFVANLPVSDVFSIQPELLYSMKGYKFSADDGFGTQVDGRKTLHYIDVPVLARINAGGLFFEAGPQFGYLVAAKFAQDGSANFPAGGYSVRRDYKALDFGYAAGLGYQLPAGPGIGLRYNGGIRKINESSGGQSVRNSAFQLYLTYMFGGK